MVYLRPRLRRVAEVLGGGHAGGWDLGSSPAISNGRIFVREGASLYCLGRKK